MFSHESRSIKHYYNIEGFPISKPSFSSYIPTKKWWENLFDGQIFSFSTIKLIYAFVIGNDYTSDIMKFLFGPTIFINFDLQSNRTFGEQIADHLKISDYRTLTTELLTKICLDQIKALDDTPHTRFLQFSLEFVEECYEPTFSEIDLTKYPISVKFLKALGIDPKPIKTLKEYFERIEIFKLWRMDSKHRDGIVYANPDTEGGSATDKLFRMIKDGKFYEFDVFSDSEEILLSSLRDLEQFQRTEEKSFPPEILLRILKISKINEEFHNISFKLINSCLKFDSDIGMILLENKLLEIIYPNLSTFTNLSILINLAKSQDSHDFLIHSGLIDHILPLFSRFSSGFDISQISQEDELFLCQLVSLVRNIYFHPIDDSFHIKFHDIFIKLFLPIISNKNASDELKIRISFAFEAFLNNSNSFFMFFIENQLLYPFVQYKPPITDGHTSFDYYNQVLRIGELIIQKRQINALTDLLFSLPKDQLVLKQTPNSIPHDYFLDYLDYCIVLKDNNICEIIFRCLSLLIEIAPALCETFQRNLPIITSDLIQNETPVSLKKEVGLFLSKLLYLSNNNDFYELLNYN